MKKLTKRIMAGFLCMGLAVFCMLPVSAAANRCNHDFRYYDKQDAIVASNLETHTVKIVRVEKCTICGEFSFTEIDRFTEGHSFEYTEIFDEPGVHHYNVRCKICGFNYNK